MALLNDIVDYVQKTSEIIASVLDIEVIICDNHYRILGDSEDKPASEPSYISETSLLNEVIEENRIVFISNRDDHIGCLSCSKRSRCQVRSMVGMPIVLHGKAIGAIGLLAQNEAAQKAMHEKLEYFKQFVQQMSELLIGKVREYEENTALSVMKERLISIIESMDSGIIAVDEAGIPTFFNSMVFDFLDEKAVRLKTPLHRLIEKPYVRSLIENCEDFKNKEVLFTKNGRQVHALISGRPVIFMNQSAGAILTIKKISDIYEEVNQLSNADMQAGLDDIIGQSEQVISLKKKIIIIAKSKSTVLITGESGTGKELIARALHNCSAMPGKPFIALNCAAIPDSLLESELFGYEEGAFSGAKRGGKLGKLQLAHGGTLFLDEIAELSLHLQAKLLRVLQERCIEKLGGIGTIPIDLRVVAATNQNLEEMVTTGEFREDLYYRLNVIPLHIPPLRERRGDIPLLLDYFLGKYNTKLNKRISGFSEDAREVLLQYSWKGNVRELQNAVEYAVNMADGNYIRLKDIHIRNTAPALTSSPATVQCMDDYLIVSIREALKQFGADTQGKDMAAQALGISRSTLYRKMKKYGLE